MKLFLEDKIGFLDIGRLVEAVVDSDSFGDEYTLSDVYECDRMAREFKHYQPRAAALTGGVFDF